MPGLKLEGILTHFPSAEEDAPFTEGQIDLFDRICSEIRGSGVEIPLRHAANSAAVLAHPRSHFDAVRPGICLYGCGGRSGPDFQPVLSLKSRVGLLKRFSAGDTIGYGRTYRAERAMLAALVHIGYADGLSRMLSNPPAGRAGRGAMLVRGWRAPIVGRVSMGHTMIDATEVSRACGIEVGDEVVVYGEQGRERISVEDVAEGLGTISYEVLCAIGSRVPRVYVAGRSDE
jgi:alanine racemase